MGKLFSSEPFLSVIVAVKAKKLLYMNAVNSFVIFKFLSLFKLYR